MNTLPENPLRWLAQRGMTLVEALVALVVLSVGMLGIAGLYVETMRSNRTALARGQAVSLANDMADRIRANPRGGINYENPGADHNCAEGAVCAEDELAEDDVWRWANTIDATLPGGAIGTVDFTPAVGLGRPDQYEIEIRWREPGEPDDLTYQVNMQLIPVT